MIQNDSHFSFLTWEKTLITEVNGLKVLEKWWGSRDIAKVQIPFIRRS